MQKARRWLKALRKQGATHVSLGVCSSVEDAFAALMEENHQLQKQVGNPKGTPAERAIIRELAASGTDIGAFRIHTRVRTLIIRARVLVKTY